MRRDFILRAFLLINVSSECERFMEYFERGGEVEVAGVSDFDLERIFECGQCFRWNICDNGDYLGAAFGKAARIRKVDDSIFISGSVNDFESIWFDYFDLGRDYQAIRHGLCIDDYMERATNFGAGIRILRQEKWEALCSFIISQCNNIPRIKKIISTLCKQFGDNIEFDGKTFYTFPSAQKLAPLDEGSLAPLRCGYRAPYIINAARAVAEGTLDLEELSRGSAEFARSTLKKLHGVGNKVADCAVLFGLNMLDAFPLDVWMKRAVAENYDSGFDPKVFSPYAGVAQQYIFYYTRSNYS